MKNETLQRAESFLLEKDSDKDFLIILADDSQEMRKIGSAIADRVRQSSAVIVDKSIPFRVTERQILVDDKKVVLGIKSQKEALMVYRNSEIIED